MEDNAIWNCEGVQVGGLGSLFGILGSWTTLSHDIDDPVGEKSQTYLCYHLPLWLISSLSLT